MQVMASPVADTTPLDNDATRIAQADTMAVDAKANGIHLPSPESAMKLETSNEIAPVTKPTTNGDHAPMDASAKPVEHVSSGIDGVAQFLPDHAADNASLFGDTDTSATVTAAVEAPTSDVREEPATAEELSNATQATSESTQNVPETQLDSAAPAEPDAMDTSFGGESDTKSQGPSAPPTKPMNDLKIETGADATLPQSDLNQSPAIIDREMEDAPSTGKVRPREDDEDEVPDAKRTKTEDEVTLPAEFKSLDAPSQPAPATQTNGSQATPTTPAPAPTEGAPAESGVHKAVDYESWPTAPMTDAQNKFLLERIRNTKKIKVSAAFKDPVNPVALNIPTYPDIVKKPMDLSTMENKLKEKKYDLIADFMADLDQMVENSELFNNKQHPVTQAGYNLRAYFLKGMGKMPRGGADEMAKPKAKKPAPPAAPKPRRESRVVPPTVKSPVAAAPAATSPQAAWPLQQDGTPLIRRDSSTADGRPKREIHRPTKDLPYANAKPKRKKFAQELKFCESVLTELLKPKYQPVSFPFIVPVDPVALNIPSYLTIIKKPMDFGTIQKNLKNGMYQNAKEFYNDAQLVFKNCFKFNPPDEPVHKMGKQLEDIFESLWKEKDDWIHQHTAVEQSHSDHYSDDEDEEDEEEEEVDPGQAQILAIQQQIAQLNAAAQQLLQAQQSGKRASPNAPGKKKKKKGAAAPTKRKSLPLNVPPPVKSSKQQKKAKAPAPLTFAQKQEISDGISTLGDSDMRRAVQIIRNGVPHLANVHDDEMELDMDEINDETLRELFKFIKSIRGGQKAGAVLVDDEDFKPPSAVPKHTGTSRPKKNKPMGKTEQEDNMRKIQEKLQSFAGGASGSSQSPPAHDASSDDDESSGSESEEE